MISLLVGIFGTKAGRMIAEIVFALLVLSAIGLHIEHKGAQEELGKLQKSSVTLIAQANARIKKDGDDYTAAQTTNQEKTNEALASNASLQSRLADSVRQYDAYRRAHPAVGSAAGVDGSAIAGECGLEDCAVVVERLAVRGNELAGSLGAVSADLQSCQRDRDALTGLPN